VIATISTTALLYVVGGVLELGGVALIGWDVYDANRQLRTMSKPGWIHTQPRFEERETGGLFELMAKVAAGNIWRRAAGVAFFAAGVIVQTAANLTNI